jgi:NAD+ diphosphatase
MSREREPGWIFAFRGNELLVHQEGDDRTSARLPQMASWRDLGLSGEAMHAVGHLRGEPALAVALPAGTEPPPGTAFDGLRRLWGKLDEEAWQLAGRAVQILDWDRNHRFCGRCGTPTEASPDERSRTCPSCGLQHFPRLSPAVIVLVTRGDELLLARSPHFAPGVYSTLAGFVEPGESLEDTVAREIHEEVGVTLSGVRYFGSQPWPFPNSLMVGFTAQWAAGELQPQPGEIEDARWFRPDALPLLPAPMSIARRLIDDYLRRFSDGGGSGEVRPPVPR